MKTKITVEDIMFLEKAKDFIVSIPADIRIMDNKIKAKYKKTIDITMNYIIRKLK